MNAEKPPESKTPNIDNDFNASESESSETKIKHKEKSHPDEKPPSNEVMVEG